MLAVDPSEDFHKAKEKVSFLNPSSDTCHPNPVLETLVKLGQATSSRAVVLLSAEGASWFLR
jgi:hypothetical protein